MQFPVFSVVNVDFRLVQPHVPKAVRDGNLRHVRCTKMLQLDGAPCFGQRVQDVSRRVIGLVVLGEQNVTGFSVHEIVRLVGNQADDPYRVWIG